MSDIPYIKIKGEDEWINAYTLYDKVHYRKQLRSIFEKHAVTFELIHDDMIMRRVHPGEQNIVLDKIFESEHCKRIIELIFETQNIIGLNKNMNVIKPLLDNVTHELNHLGFLGNFEFNPETNNLLLIFDNNYLQTRPPFEARMYLRK